MSPWVLYSALLGASFLISLDAFKTKVTGLQTTSVTCKLQFFRPSDFYYLRIECLTFSSLAMGWKEPDLTSACFFLSMWQMFMGCLMLFHHQQLNQLMSWEGNTLVGVLSLFRFFVKSLAFPCI